MTNVETIVHTLSDGTKLEIRVTPPNKPSPETPHFMQVGATYDGADYDKYLEQFPLTSVCRVFSNNLPPSWSDTRINKLISAKTIPFVSWKTHNLEAINAWLDNMPGTDVLPCIYATEMHEPEPKKILPSTFKQRIRETLDTIKSHPNGNRVLFGPVLTRQWTENTAGRSYDLYDPGIGDFIGCDMYANSWEDKYPSPVEFVRYFCRYATNKDNGRSIWVPELGAIKMKTDPTGEQRAEWMRAVFAELYTWKTEVVIWWNDMGTPANDGTERDFRLDDEPSKNMFNLILSKYNGS